MPESHKFLCTVCGATLDYPASFEGQEKQCEKCGLNSILKNIPSSKGVIDGPVPIKLPPPKDPIEIENHGETDEPAAQLPQTTPPHPEVSSPETPSQGAAGPAITSTEENVPLAPEAEVRGKPSKVKAICMFHCVGGAFNILLALSYLIFGILLLFSGGKSMFGILTKLGGPLLMVMGVLVMAIGAFEVFSAFKHFGAHARPKRKYVKFVAILEIVSFLGGSCLSVIFGIMSLIFLKDQQVKEYYE